MHPPTLKPSLPDGLSQDDVLNWTKDDVSAWVLHKGDQFENLSTKLYDDGTTGRDLLDLTDFYEALSTELCN